MNPYILNFACMSRHLLECHHIDTHVKSCSNIEKHNFLSLYSITITVMEVGDIAAAFTLQLGVNSKFQS